MIGLTMKLGIVTAGVLFPAHSVAVPAQIVAPHVTPVTVPAIPSTRLAPSAGQEPDLPLSVTPNAPVLSTSQTGYECMVTLTDGQGNTMTYSPGPAVNGNCAVGTPQPYEVTYGG